MNDFLEKIIEKTQKNNSGFSLHYLFLYSLIIGMEAKEVLELGAGFSTPVILSAIEKTGGNLITCDTRDLKDTGNDPDLGNRYPNWKYLQGDTRETLNKLGGPKFDVVLHDGSHEWRVVYKDLRKVLKLIKRNGIILVHDTEHPAFRLKLATKLALLFVRHEITTLPYGYGLTIIRILGNKKNGSVNLTWEKQN